MITSITRAPTSYQPPTGHESPGQARDDGWLGQTPPPSPPRTTVCPPPDPEPVYANPQLAPDPWLNPGSLFPDDPTLFG